MQLLLIRPLIGLTTIRSDLLSVMGILLSTERLKGTIIINLQSDWRHFPFKFDRTFFMLLQKFPKVSRIYKLYVRIGKYNANAQNIIVSENISKNIHRKKKFYNCRELNLFMVFFFNQKVTNNIIVGDRV